MLARDSGVAPVLCMTARFLSVGVNPSHVIHPSSIFEYYCIAKYLLQKKLVRGPICIVKVHLYLPSMIINHIEAISTEFTSSSPQQRIPKGLDKLKHCPHPRYTLTSHPDGGLGRLI